MYYCFSPSLNDNRGPVRRRVLQSFLFYLNQSQESIRISPSHLGEVDGGDVKQAFFDHFWGAHDIQINLS